jgi:hypothetical protein
MPDLTIIIMAKAPRPGLVKTRLVECGIDPGAAAEIAGAMLACVVRRWSACGTVWLAVTPDGCGESLRKSLMLPDVRIIDQGPGDLGARMARAWRGIAPDRPVAFLGIDSPDVPAGHMRAIGPALRQADAALGPTGDGGYWTLAARRYLPALVERIDWGSAIVYDQTRQRAREAGLSVVELPPWHDVDDGADLASLHARLSGLKSGPGASSEDDAAPLDELRRRLEMVLGPCDPDLRQASGQA